MTTQTTVARAVRFGLLALASASVTPLAYAADAPADENADNVEKITVTGSRIVREGAVAPTPVTVISGEELLSTGVTNIGEALNRQQNNQRTGIRRAFNGCMAP